MDAIRHWFLGALLVAGLGQGARAQTDFPLLRGADNLRIALGVEASVETRQACGITPALEQRMYDAMRARLTAGGIRSPAQMQRLSDSPGQSVLVAVPADRQLPLLVVAINTARLPLGGDVACAAMVISKFDIQVTGGRTIPTQQPVDQAISAWVFDTMDISNAERFPPMLADMVDQTVSEFVADARGRR